MDDEDGRLVRHLAELGLDAEVDEALALTGGRQRGVLRVARGASIQAFELVDDPDVPLSSARVSGSGRPVFVHTRHVAAKTGDAFRRAGVQYLDDGGNAWIEFGDVYIDVRGRPRPPGEVAPPRATGNLFSRGRAQVVLALLAWPTLWEAPQREVAQAAGVSLGQAHNTLALLTQAGYDAQHAGPGRVNLLDLWAAAFPSGLADRLTLATYRGEVGSVKQADTSDVATISGEAAVPELLRPTKLTVYVTELNPRLAIANRWRSDGKPNIVVRRKFWNDPTSADSVAPDVDVAPWPLIYADLLASDNPRARDAARELRERCERPQ